MPPRFLLLLGAGASIEAGLPSAIAVTEDLVSLASDASSRIRRLGRVVRALREEAARHSGVPVGDVDFEHLFGALVEAVERKEPTAGGMIAEFVAPLLDGSEPNRVLLDLLLYLRNLFLPSQSVDYLTGLLDTVRKHSGAIATLNYDLTVERWFVERRLPIRVGFEHLTWQGFEESHDGPELLKLHGSVHWARRTLSMAHRDSILAHLLFHSDPFPVGVDHPARWASGELMEGVRPLMNIGVSKEQLYLTPPFSAIFRRFEAHLAAVDLIVVVGYSFRDYLINRLLLQALKLQLTTRGRRPAVVVVDPDVKTLLTKRPVLQALDKYHVLITRELKAGDVREADILLWLQAVLPEAPTGITYETPPAPRLDHMRERLADVCLELASLRRMIRVALQHPTTPWRILETIVVTVERCRGTYDQAGVKSTLPPRLRRTIVKMHSNRDIESLSWRAAAADLLAGLAPLTAQLDAVLDHPNRPLTPDSFDGVTAD